jgi:hypothetical protein
MNDFDYDVLQKKRIARNAKYQKKGSRNKKCTLPDDYLTPAQRKALNGPTKTYKLGGPMDWSTFRSMPDDLQREYLKKLIDRFHINDALLGEMFGVNQSTVGRIRSELGLTNVGRRRTKQEQRNAFYTWCAGGAGTEEPAVEQAPPEPEPENAPNPEPAPAPMPAAKVVSGAFTVSGTADEALELLRMMFRDDHRAGTFTLTFTYDEEDDNELA